MNAEIFPRTRAGKWSVWLQVIFLTVIATSVILVIGLGVLSFDDTWWDVTVTIFLASIAAFILGVIAIKKYHERSVFVYASTVLGVLSILFILLHSLFVNDQNSPFSGEAKRGLF